MAVQPLASQVGVAPACRALGVPRASFYRRQRPAPGASAAPSYARPGPACVRTRARPRSCSPARASSTGHRPRSSRRCSMKAGICAPSARCTGSWPRTSRCESGAISAVIPGYTKPELVATGPNQTWSWDITRLRGPKRWTSFYLYVLLDIFSRYVVGLDGCRSGERRARRDADRGNLSQARHRAPGAHPAFGPRRADDQQVHRPTPRRPRGHPLSERAPRSATTTPSPRRSSRP